MNSNFSVVFDQNERKGKKIRKGNKENECFACEWISTRKKKSFGASINARGESVSIFLFLFLCFRGNQQRTFYPLNGETTAGKNAPKVEPQTFRNAARKLVFSSLISSLKTKRDEEEEEINR